MYHVALTPNEYPANALSASSETLMGAIADLLNSIALVSGSEEWFVARVLEAAKEAVDHLENDEPAKGVWSDMGSEDDAFSIDIFCEDDARYVIVNDDHLLAPHGAVGLAIGRHNIERWIYDESEFQEWEKVLLPVYRPSEDGLDAAVRSVVNGDNEERCEHTGMTRDELESLCGTKDLIVVTGVVGAGEVNESQAIGRTLRQHHDAKITQLIRDVTDGDCALSAIFDDGSVRKLFNFYIDELAFHDADLIGKTEMQSHELKSQRDMNYLRS